MNKEKKPIYKKMWFWLIVIIVVGGGFRALSGETDNKQSNNNTEVTSKDNQSSSSNHKKNSSNTSAKDATPTIMSLSQSNIEKLSNLDGVKIERGDITVIRLGERQDKDTKDVYKNVYYANGDYRYDGHIYKYNMTFNFDRKNILDDKMKYQIIQYGNSATKVGTFEPNLTANVEQ